MLLAQSRDQLLLRGCPGEVSLHAWQEVTIVRGQIPSYWWDLLFDLMLSLFTFLPCTVLTWPFSGRFCRELDAGINDSSLWSRCRFLASQNVSSSLFLFSSTETEALELFWQHTEWYISRLLQFLFPTACVTVSSVVWELTRHSEDTFFRLHLRATLGT